MTVGDSHDPPTVGVLCDDLVIRSKGVVHKGASPGGMILGPQNGNRICAFHS